MFTGTSQQVYSFFSNMPEFNAVMKRTVDGEAVTLLFPIVALEGNNLPLTTFVVGEQTPETKDRYQLDVTVIFWFDQNSYDQCCAFTDAMNDKIKAKHNFIYSSIDYDEAIGTYSGTVTFSLDPDDDVVIIPDVPIDPGCAVPVVTAFPDNQFTNSIFVTAGQTKTWQIVANNNATSYDIRLPFIPGGILPGLTFDSVTGFVTYVPQIDAVGQMIYIGFDAINQCGIGEYAANVQVVTTDVSILQPPSNPEASDINSILFGSDNKNFMYSVDVLPYMNGIITAYEIWIKGPLTGNIYVLQKNFYGGLLNSMLGLVANRIDSLTPGAYKVKSRLRNGNGDYSAFSDELTVNV